MFMVFLCHTKEKNLKHFSCFLFLSWHCHDIVKWNYLVMCILEISLFLAANCSFLLLNYCRRCQCVKICIFKILLSCFCIECDTIVHLIFSLFLIFKHILQMQQICLHLKLKYNNRMVSINQVIKRFPFGSLNDVSNHKSVIYHLQRCTLW